MTNTKRLTELGMTPALAKELTNFDYSTLELFDDFLGKTLSTRWAATAGSDSPAGAAINAQVGGVLRLTTGDSNASQAADAIQVNGDLNWKAANGGLTMTARVKISAIAAVQVNIGFTDQTAALEMPITLSSTTYTTNATDAAVFVFDTNATTDTIRCMGVANDVDATHVDTGNAWDTNWHVFRIDIDSSGNAKFYIDGAYVGTVASAVTASVALTPVFAARSLAANSKTLDVDYVRVAMKR